MFTLFHDNDRQSNFKKKNRVQYKYIYIYSFNVIAKDGIT